MIAYNPKKQYPPSPALGGSATDRALSIVERCGGGRAHGGRWLVPCPSHEDRDPSLSIRDVGEKVLLHCFAGCSTAAICAAIGITMRDLFADDRPPVATRKPRSVRPMPFPPEGPADPVALKFALEFLAEDPAILEVDQVVALLRQAATHPLQWLWVERQLPRHGMTPSMVWQAIFPKAAYSSDQEPPSSEERQASLAHQRPPRPLRTTTTISTMAIVPAEEIPPCL
jgi:hypothetical protein